MWEPPTTGNPPTRYVVDVSDRLGQIVESASVEGVFYSTSHEGTIRVSVAAIDAAGNIGPYSEWSDPVITPDEFTYLANFSSRIDMPLLVFASNYVQTLLEVWVDPHEE